MRLETGGINLQPAAFSLRPPVCGLFSYRSLAPFPRCTCTIIRFESMSPTCRLRAYSNRRPSEYTVQKKTAIRCVVQQSIIR